MRVGPVTCRGISTQAALDLISGIGLTYITTVQFSTFSASVVALGTCSAHLGRRAASPARRALPGAPEATNHTRAECQRASRHRQPPAPTVKAAAAVAAAAGRHTLPTSCL